MSVDPQTWPEATEYFAKFTGGHYDGESYLDLFYTEKHLRESDDGKRLYIGRAGADGIEFLYRHDAPGLWAWFPISGEMRKVADTLSELVDGWFSGKIKV